VSFVRSVTVTPARGTFDAPEASKTLPLIASVLLLPRCFAPPSPLPHRRSRQGATAKWQELPQILRAGQLHIPLSSQLVALKVYLAAPCGR